MKQFLLPQALLLGALGLARAQPGSTGPAPTQPVAPTETPLDGGASLLLAGGVAFGLRRLRAHRRA